MLAYQTCQWWNAVFVQFTRFLDVLEKNHGGTPWEPGDENSMILAERFFLIMAIHHAIEDLETLDHDLQQKGDASLHSVIQEIEKAAPLEDIKNLRNMNEHYLDYLMNEGHKQNQFFTKDEKNRINIFTSAAGTYINGDLNEFKLWKLSLNALLFTMKKQLPIVQEKTRAIYYEAYAAIQ